MTELLIFKEWIPGVDLKSVCTWTSFRVPRQFTERRCAKWQSGKTLNGKLTAQALLPRADKDATND